MDIEDDIIKPHKIDFKPEPTFRRNRYIIFLKDVFILSITAFGGPQAHLAMFLELLVKKRGYITEEEMMELQALCQILPGPTSTQTITAIAFKMGGPNLAYLTLFIWILPSVIFMTCLGIGLNFIQNEHFNRFLEPIAVGFVIHAGYAFSRKILTNQVRIFLALLATICSYFFQSPFIAPILVIAGGVVTALEYKKFDKKEKKDKLKINWSNFVLFLTVPVVAAVVGALTGWLPIRLFENFYRNGSLVFGGGHTLMPMLLTEFVQFKHYLKQEDFLSGWAMVQMAPGPVFGFTAFIGAISMKNYGIGGQIIGSVMATAGIFLPGTFLIFFVYRFWDQLKQYRVVRASLEGITSASIGLIGGTSIILLQSLRTNPIDYFIVVTTFLLLNFTKIPPFLLIIAGLIAGYLI